MKLYVLLATLLAYISACSNEPIRQFGAQKDQDLKCLQQFGGQRGYCDK